MVDPIVVAIPVELTQAMIIRRGKVEDEKRARELAHELHDVVARVMELFRAQERRLVEHPEDPDGEITVLEEARLPNALVVKIQHLNPCVRPGFRRVSQRRRDRSV
jgi:hypothetical protein